MTGRAVGQTDPVPLPRLSLLQPLDRRIPLDGVLRGRQAQIGEKAHVRRDPRFPHRYLSYSVVRPHLVCVRSAGHQGRNQTYRQKHLHGW